MQLPAGPSCAAGSARLAGGSVVRGDVSAQELRLGPEIWAALLKPASAGWLPSLLPLPFTNHLHYNSNKMMQTAQTVMSKVPGVDPRPAQRMQVSSPHPTSGRAGRADAPPSQAFSGLNDGPAETAARITGLTQSEPAKDNSPFYTSKFTDVLAVRASSLTPPVRPRQPTLGR